MVRYALQVMRGSVPPNRPARLSHLADTYTPIFHIAAPRRFPMP
ncbi:hypothetical protein EC2853500_5185 [Escherichia coli 2853500]|nr:hypothetical protein EC2853500_5185 [Escherichia coli 2853500]